VIYQPIPNSQNGTIDDNPKEVRGKYFRIVWSDLFRFVDHARLREVIDEWLKFVEAKVSRGQHGEQSEKEG